MVGAAQAFWRRRFGAGVLAQALWGRRLAQTFWPRRSGPGVLVQACFDDRSIRAASGATRRHWPQAPGLSRRQRHRRGRKVSCIGRRTLCVGRGRGADLAVCGSPGRFAPRSAEGATADLRHRPRRPVERRGCATWHRSPARTPAPAPPRRARLSRVTSACRTPPPWPRPPRALRRVPARARRAGPAGRRCRRAGPRRRVRAVPARRAAS